MNIRRIVYAGKWIYLLYAALFILTPTAYAQLNSIPDVVDTGVCDLGVTSFAVEANAYAKLAYFTSCGTTQLTSDFFWSSGLK